MHSEEAGRNIVMKNTIDDDESSWREYFSLPQPARHSKNNSCFNIFRCLIRPSYYNASSLPQPRDQYSNSKYSCFNFIRRLIRTPLCNNTSSLPPLVQAEPSSHAMVISPIFSIPNPILMQILSKLPVTTIRNCRCVCSCFRNLISDPQFAQLHLSTISQPSLLLRSPYYGSEFPMHFVESIDPFIVDGHFRNEKEKEKITVDIGDIWISINTNWKFNLKCYIPTGGIKVSSCNGLLCFSMHQTYKFDPYVICNPVINECVIVPMIKKDFFTLCGSGFGFCPRTNQYKVLRFLYPDYPNTNQYKLEAEINTLGSNLWRRVNNVPQHVDYRSECCFLNGALHWIVYDSKHCFESMCCFDIGKERFQPFPGPSQFCELPTEYSTDRMKMGVLNDVLSVVFYQPYDIDIWVMKDYGVQESWTKECVIEIPRLENYRAHHYRPLMVLNNVDMLLFDPVYNVYSWNMRTKSLRKVYFNGISEAINPMTYIPSFVSIKNAATWRHS